MVDVLRFALVGLSGLVISQAAYAGGWIVADAGGSYTLPAESSVTLSASGTVYDPDCKYRYYEWDTDGDGTYDTSPSTTTSAVFSSAGLDGSSAQSVLVTVKAYCYDKDFDLDDISTASALVYVTNVDPVIIGVSKRISLVEGSSGNYSVTYADVESADTHTVAWNWGDTHTSTGSAASHSWVENGTYAISVTVTDDDSGSDSSSFSVTVMNASPVISSLTTSSTGDEGVSHSFSVAYTDAGASDTHAVSWSFDDGQFASGATASNTFADDGTYSVTVSVCDDDSACVSSGTTVNINNVDPVVTGTPNATATEGVLYSFAPGVTDSGAVDTHVWSGGGSGDATVDSATGEILWTPTWQEVGSQELTVTVTDDDSGAGAMAWSVVVAMADQDGDGMSDGWEDDNGFDSFDPSDAADDSDGDGRTNLQEWLFGTDPQVSELIGAPELLEPTDGQEVASATPTVVAGNADNPGGMALTYTFDLYLSDDITTSIGMWSSDELDGQAEALIDSVLVEDTWYSWRAMAADGVLDGPWSDLSEMFVNESNNGPDEPLLITPFDGSVVNELSPVFVFSDAFDPDSESLTYSAEVWDAYTSESIEMVSFLAATEGVVEWSPSTVLVQGASLCWTAWATDDEALDGAAAVPACFTVDEENLAPTSPVILAPTDGASVSTSTHDLIIENCEDPEGRAVVMEVELDVTESFDSEQWTLYELELDEGDVTNSSLENLLEDTTYFLRARCFDGALISDWDQISFSVNTVNHSPESPVLVSPADGSVTTSEITFVVENSFDEDGDELTYSFAIIDYFGSEEFLEEGYPEGDGTTELYVEGLANGTYTWSVKATDSFGGESDWSVESEFTVDVEEELVVTGVEGDAGGCGCSSDGTSRGALGWLVLLGAVVGSSRLQRRKG